jgi:hypothetical protein
MFIKMRTSQVPVRAVTMRDGNLTQPTEVALSVSKGC